MRDEELDAVVRWIADADADDVRAIMAALDAAEMVGEVVDWLDETPHLDTIKVDAGAVGVEDYLDYLDENLAKEGLEAIHPTTVPFGEAFRKLEAADVRVLAIAETEEDGATWVQVYVSDLERLRVVA